MNRLIYKEYQYNYPEIKYIYQYQDREYVNKIILENIGQAEIDLVDENVLDILLNHIGLAFLPYLFNLDWFDQIDVRPIKLEKKDIAFFEDYLFKGLGEFRYKNRIKKNKTIINSSSSATKNAWLKVELNQQAILMNGGGKDSVVAAELLKSIDLPFKWFSLNLSPNRKKMAELSGNKDNIAVKWQLEPNIDRNAKYQGHKPLSSFLAFLSLLPAVVYKSQYIITANEYSANFGNLEYQGEEINHQYSKSFEFEKKFSDYLRLRLKTNLQYFSVLRPLWEVQIAKIFSSYPKYLSHFISCNKGQKAKEKGFWCKECPKCAFIFLALYPFLTSQQIKTIFGQDLFENPTTVKYIQQLISEGPKPLECIGTKEECLLLAQLSFEKNPSLKESSVLTDLVKTFTREKKETTFPKEKYLSSYERENQIPSDLIKKVNLFFKKNLA